MAGISRDYQQLALTQIFPSGWEIRNARMEGTEQRRGPLPIQLSDVRDDRVMTYFDLWQATRAVTYRVMLNAATRAATTCPALIAKRCTTNTSMHDPVGTGWKW